MGIGKCDKANATKFPKGTAVLAISHKHRLVVSNNVLIPVILEN